MGRMVEAESFMDYDSYALEQMMLELREGIWNDLDKNISTDVYKRNLQVAWIERLSQILNKQTDTNDKENPGITDLKAMALEELNFIKKSIDSRKDSIRSSRARSHYLFCLKRIEDDLFASSKMKN
jgi:hypothetical protein